MLNSFGKTSWWCLLRDWRDQGATAGLCSELRHGQLMIDTCVIQLITWSCEKHNTKLVWLLPPLVAVAVEARQARPWPEGTCARVWMCLLAGLQSHWDVLTYARSHSLRPSHIWEGEGELSRLHFFLFMVNWYLLPGMVEWVSRHNWTIQSGGDNCSGKSYQQAIYCVYLCSQAFMAICIFPYFEYSLIGRTLTRALSHSCWFLGCSCGSGVRWPKHG